MRRLISLFTIFIALMISRSALALETSIKLPGPLVDTDWLEENLTEVKILDVRQDIESFTRKAILVRKRFTGDLKLRRSGAHIPGSVLVDFLNIRTSKDINERNIRYLVPEKSEFEELMRSWGINRGDTIVITHQGRGNSDVTLATRLYWQIKYFGHDNVSLLDGGVAQWLLEEKKASIISSEPAMGDWVATAMRNSILATSDDVSNAINDMGEKSNLTQLVDTRSMGFYLGLLKQSYVRKKGHIPGAKMFPNELLTSNGAGAYFTDVEDIQAMSKELGIKFSSNLITYCNSGQFASASWFVFSELMGNKNVKLYDGSMHQWAIEKRPINKMVIE